MISINGHKRREHFSCLQGPAWHASTADHSQPGLLTTSAISGVAVFITYPSCSAEPAGGSIATNPIKESMQASRYTNGVDDGGGGLGLPHREVLLVLGCCIVLLHRHALPSSVHL